MTMNGCAVFNKFMSIPSLVRAIQCTQFCAKSVKKWPWAHGFSQNVTFILKRREYLILERWHVHNELLHGRVNEVDDQSWLYSSQRSAVACGNAIVVRSSGRDEVIFSVWYGISVVYSTQKATVAFRFICNWRLRSGRYGNLARLVFLAICSSGQA